MQALDKRERTVADQLEEAKRNQEEARRLLAEHETRLAGAATEVKQLLDQARRDADVQKQQILESAQAAATAEKDRAVREIHAAKNVALQELAQEERRHGGRSGRADRASPAQRRRSLTTDR